MICLGQPEIHNWNNATAVQAIKSTAGAIKGTNVIVYRCPCFSSVLQLTQLDSTEYTNNTTHSTTPPPSLSSLPRAPTPHRPRLSASDMSDCLPGCVYSTRGKAHAYCEYPEEAAARVAHANAAKAYSSLRGKICRDHCVHTKTAHTKCQTKERYDAELLPIRDAYAKAKKAAEDASDVEAKRKWRAAHPDSFGDYCGYEEDFRFADYESYWERKDRHSALLSDWSSGSYGRKEVTEAQILISKTRWYEYKLREMEENEYLREAEEKRKQEQEEAEKRRKQKEADEKHRARMEAAGKRMSLKGVLRFSKAERQRYIPLEDDEKKRRR